MYPLEVKYKAIIHYTHFMSSLRKVAKMYNVSKSTLHRWVKDASSRPSTLPKRLQRQRRSKTKIREEVTECIRSTFQSNPFCSIPDLTQRISVACNLPRSARTVCRMVKNAGFSYKKAFRTVSRQHEPADVLRLHSCRWQR